MDNKKRKLLISVIGLVLVLACSSTATAHPTTSTKVVIPTSTATPSVLTCEQVEAVRRDIRNRLTSAQQDLPNNELDTYIESVKGKEFQFSGEVYDVATNFDKVIVYVEIKGCNRIYLLGIPKEVAITLNKGQRVSGTGTISQEFGKNLIISVDVTEFNH